MKKALLLLLCSFLMSCGMVFIVELFIVIDDDVLILISVIFGSTVINWMALCDIFLGGK